MTLFSSNIEDIFNNELYFEISIVISLERGPFLFGKYFIFSNNKKLKKMIANTSIILNFIFFKTYLTLPTINDAFVPPKPKEFDNAVLTVISFAFKGTKSIPVAFLQGLFKFKVGGTILLQTLNIENIASTAPAAPSICPTEDFVELIDILPILFLNNL